MTCHCLPGELITALGGAERRRKGYYVSWVLSPAHSLPRGSPPPEWGVSPGFKAHVHWLSDLKAGHVSSPRLSFLTCKIATTVPTSLG